MSGRHFSFYDWLQQLPGSGSCPYSYSHGEWCKTHNVPAKPVLYRFDTPSTSISLHNTSTQVCTTPQTILFAIRPYTFPAYIPTDSQWMISASVCREDGFQLATTCCLLSVYLFWIAIIEATHFSDANLAWCRDAFSHLVRSLRCDQ